MLNYLAMVMAPVKMAWKEQGSVNVMLIIMENLVNIVPVIIAPSVIKIYIFEIYLCSIIVI